MNSLEQAYNAVIGFFQSGGLFMYPILLTLAVGIAIAIERWLFLGRALDSNQRSWTQLAPLLAAQKFREALAAAKEADSGIGRILQLGLQRRETSTRRDEIEMALEEGLMDELPRLEQRTHYLAMLSNTATLLGLLGTVLGLIEAFAAVANANPVEKADLLSAAISVAMNCTAFGLLTAIPLLILHSVLQTRTNELVENIEAATLKYLNMVAGASPLTAMPAAGHITAAQPANP